MRGVIELVGPNSDLPILLQMAFLMMMRSLPIIFQTPFMGGRLVPPESRMGIAMLVTVLAFPFAEASMSGPLTTNAGVFIALMLKELFIGFIIGFVATELFYAMEIGGRLLDVMRGSNMAEVHVPELGFRASPIGDFNFQLLTVVFCTLNGHGFFLEAVIESWRIVPIDAWPASSVGFGHIIDEVLRYTAHLIPIAFALVFPGVFAAFITDVVFGTLNKIAPQLNAYFMAMGVKAMAGLLFFLAAMNLMIGELGSRLEYSLAFLKKLISLFGEV